MYDSNLHFHELVLLSCEVIRFMDQNRQLAAIMFTDIIGYTAIMSADEKNALEVLDKNRQIHLPLFEKYHGTKIKEMGDGTLAIFSTASDAVMCAKEIQEQISNEPVLKLRIGIHLAEIVVSDEDVFGDGVNIASRIENIAPSQGIYISDPVFNSIRNSREFETCYLGEVRFKNSDSDTKIYAVRTDSLPLPDKSYFKKMKGEINKNKSNDRQIKLFAGILIFIFLMLSLYQFDVFNVKTIFGPTENGKTIVVLPFENLSGNEEEDYLSLGITEDIVNQLLKIKDLKVIDRSNLRKYVYHDKTFGQIGKELDVSNLLIGSVNKGSGQIRITAKLIDATTEEAVWTNVYNKPFKDIFQILTQVAVSIANELQAEVTTEEVERIKREPTINFTAYDLYLKGKEYYSRYTESENTSAINLYRQALAIDPEFTLAHAGLSDAFSQLAQKSNIKDPWLDSAYQHAKFVKQNDPANSSGYKSMGLYFSIQGNTVRAIEEFKQAVDIDRNIEAVINLSRLYYRSGLLNQALEILTEAQWYNPMEADLWFNFGATYYRFSEFDQANYYLEKALSINPNHINSLLLQWFIAVLSQDNEISFTVAQKLAAIGNDDTDKLLIVLERVIQQKQKDTSEPASILIQLLNGRELDYIDIPYVYNLVAYIYFNGGHKERAKSLFDYKVQDNQKRLSKGEVSYKFHYEIAQIQSIYGENKEAANSLKEALEKGWYEYPYIVIDPCFQDIISSESIQILIRQSRSKLDSIKALAVPIQNRPKEI